jgi:hypothetical protein
LPADSGDNVGHWQVWVASQVAPAAQSPSLPQGADLQTEAPQAQGAQLDVPPAWHVPAPSQTEAAVSIEVVPSHVAGAQTVPDAWRAHEPLPSQVPLVPQVAGAMGRQLASGSLPPFGTGWQLPALPVTAHDEQAAQLEAPQHTDSTQWPLMHSVPSVQAPPLGVRFVHEPLAQVNAGAQSPSSEQVVRQAAPSSEQA